MSVSAEMVVSARSGSCLGVSSPAWASNYWSSPSPGGCPPRQLVGHEGLLISHYCYDRAVFVACVRHHTEMHEA
eukprot:10173091-Prorocentrum_lima.AAC.1